MPALERTIGSGRKGLLRRTRSGAGRRISSGETHPIGRRIRSDVGLERPDERPNLDDTPAAPLRSPAAPAAETPGAGTAAFGQLGRALAFAAAERPAVALIIAITVGAGAVGAFDPLIVRAVVDAVVAHGPPARLWGGVALLAALVLLREGMVALSSWLTWRTRLRVQYRILD